MYPPLHVNVTPANRVRPEEHQLLRMRSDLFVELRLFPPDGNAK